MTTSAWVLQSMVGVSYAAVLFVVASGLTLTFGALRILNFAHGSFFMLAGYVAFTVTSQWAGATNAFWLAVVAAPIVIAVLAFLMERFLLRPIYAAEHVYQFLLTFALLIAINDATRGIWGPLTKSVLAPPQLAGSASFLGSTFPVYRLFVILVALLVALGLWFMLYRTRLGIVIRAVVVDREMAVALGIDAPRVNTTVFMLGSAMAGLGGVLISPLVVTSLASDNTMLLDSFIVIVIGGMGSLPGVLVGALLLGLSQAFGMPVASRFVVIFPAAIMALVLLLRPGGLFGEAVPEW